ncbi:MAG: hypothetical protein QXQ02_00010 [Halobacteria archaeon]
MTRLLALAKQLWPNDVFYSKQREILDALVRCDEVVVPAANKVGKDWVAARAIILYFLTHYPCRIITTSAKDDHLRVLWGEIMSALVSSNVPLLYDRGGPIIALHHELQRMYKGSKSPLCYVRGMVASRSTLASMQGHHAKYTLFVCDEASSVPDEYFDLARTWAKKMLIFGNPWPCDNYFFRAVEGGNNDPGGDIVLDSGYCFRKVIRITADDSPNVKLAKRQIRAGLEPTGEIIVPGILTYDEYIKRRKLWDKMQQTICLDAKFYKESALMLFPDSVLKRCMMIADKLMESGVRRIAQAMGVDGGEGRDYTVWTVIDRHGVMEQLSLKTSDTSDIPGITISLIKKYNISPKNVLFDRGGGGKQIVDYLRRIGYDVRSIGFGESARSPHLTNAKKSVASKIDSKETAYAYKNRRAELYGVLSSKLEEGFGIPRSCSNLIKQLSVIPKRYDAEGRLVLPPKDNVVGQKTLRQILGRSPDEADSLALAVYAMVKRPTIAIAGAL